ncbi:unnamed protein product [Ilex paraguariensis]|uniref:Uncharacterized protein n=1 Tax=Ilex paraguariensis TaxID=185542 RepID=A0ABC8QY03_9AQUA
MSPWHLSLSPDLSLYLYAFQLSYTPLSISALFCEATTTSILNANVNGSQRSYSAAPSLISFCVT